VRTPTATQPQISALDPPREPMPGQAPQPTLGHEPRYITVAEGQSLIRIAHANHVSAKAVAVANHLERPYRLKIGSQLLMPDP
jgi:LysM repeat protein